MTRQRCEFGDHDGDPAELWIASGRGKPYGVRNTVWMIIPGLQARSTIFPSPLHAHDQNVVKLQCVDVVARTDMLASNRRLGSGKPDESAVRREPQELEEIYPSNHRETPLTPVINVHLPLTCLPSPHLFQVSRQFHGGEIVSPRVVAAPVSRRVARHDNGPVFRQSYSMGHRRSCLIALRPFAASTQILFVGGRARDEHNIGGRGIFTHALDQKRYSRRQTAPGLHVNHRGNGLTPLELD